MKDSEPAIRVFMDTNFTLDGVIAMPVRWNLQNSPCIADGVIIPDNAFFLNA